MTTEIVAKQNLPSGQRPCTRSFVYAVRPFPRPFCSRGRRVFFYRRHEEGVGATNARRVRAAIAAQEPGPGAQMVQRLDVAGQAVQATRLPRGTRLGRPPAKSVKNGYSFE